MEGILWAKMSNEKRMWQLALFSGPAFRPLPFLDPRYWQEPRKSQAPRIPGATDCSFHMTPIRVVMEVTNSIKSWQRERGAQKTEEETDADSQWLAYIVTQALSPGSPLPRPELLASLLYCSEGRFVLLRTKAINPSELKVQGREVPIPLLLAGPEASSESQCPFHWD